MASIQIPNLPAVIGLSGAELFEGVQAGTSVKISLDQIIAAARGGTPATLPIPVSLGGTGLDTFTIGDIMYASATQTFSTLADVALGNAIISGGVGAAPSYGKIGLTTHVDGVLPVANGGTGVTSSTGTGSVVLSDSPALTGQVSFADGTAAAPSITNTGDLNAGLFFPAADTVAVSTAGVERLRVDSSGNVGIGTTSPATQLDLAANNTAGTALNVLRFTDTDLSVTAPQELGKIEFYSADNSAPGAGVKASITGIAEVGNPGGGIAFSTDLLTGTPIERMRIDRNGNVGIGTTTPTSIVDVYSATPTFNFRGDAATNITSTRSSNNSGGPNVNFIKARGTTASQTAVASSDYMGFLNFAAYGGATNRTIAQIYAQVSTYTSDTDISSSINFTTTPTGSITPQDRMRIDASGNVGIGTTTPSEKLSVDGNITMLAATTETRGIEIGNGRTGNGNSYIDFVTDATYTDFGLRIIRGNTGANSSSLITHRGIGNFTIQTQEAAPITFATNNAEAMRILATGNVGIGTTSPGAALDINGNAFVRGSGAEGGEIAFFNPDRTTTGMTVDVSSANVGRIFQSQNNSTLQLGQLSGTGGIVTLHTAANEAMRILATGDVGIGTTSPITLLHVDGASTTNGVVYKAQAAQTSKAAAATLTIAELLTGIIQYTGAVATLTLPTGASIEGGLPATFPTNMSFDVSFINTGAALLTIGANGNTTVGTMTVATLTSAMLRFRKTAANTYTVYRIS